MNKITPFCCDMSDKTEDEIRALHKMCMDAGANENDSADEWVGHADRANYMGVDGDNDLLSLDHIGTPFNNNVIPPEEVPTHLGLLKECETPHLSDSPTKWTKAMQKEGAPLSVGMLALYNGEDMCKVKYILVGSNSVVVEFNGTECVECVTCLHPFPDEETLEQKEQREEFIKVTRQSIVLGELIAEGTMNSLYEEIKHLFKY